MICILKASSSLLDRKSPSYIIWAKILDTVELVYQLDLKLATHFGLKRTSLPVSIYCFKSHEPIRNFHKINCSEPLPLNTGANTKAPSVNY